VYIVARCYVSVVAALFLLKDDMGRPCLKHGITDPGALNYKDGNAFSPALSVPKG
jgi:hypothetical protein